MAIVPLRSGSQWDSLIGVRPSRRAQHGTAALQSGVTGGALTGLVGMDVTVPAGLQPGQQVWRARALKY